ncbi:hypothetical protein H6G91_37220 [Nostoc muscorum FACHB-395]|nr:hypothetical protein [Desmonostoc muscorum FACHB-395]
MGGQGRVGGVGGVGGNAAFIDVQLFNFSSFSPPSPHLRYSPPFPHSPHSKSKLYQGFAINLVPFTSELNSTQNACGSGCGTNDRTRSEFF